MNHKTTTALVAISVVAATLLAAGTVAAAIGIAGSDHPAFAHQKKGYYKGHKGDDFKGISQQNIEPQIVLCLTAGGNSPIQTACTTTATATDSNTGGATGLGHNRETEGRGQGNSQQNIIPQKVICLTAGGNSPIQTACNTRATSTDSNTGGVPGVSMRENQHDLQHSAKRK